MNLYSIAAYIILFFVFRAAVPQEISATTQNNQVALSLLDDDPDGRSSNPQRRSCKSLTRLDWLQLFLRCSPHLSPEARCQEQHEMKHEMTHLRLVQECI